MFNAVNTSLRLPAAVVTDHRFIHDKPAGVPFAVLPSTMFRFAVLLLITFALVSGASAVQLGDGRKQIVAQYGLPTVGSLDADRGMGTYRWNGWRLDIEIIQGVAQRLIFTKDTSSISEAEERQLLDDNGGTAAWQPAGHVSVDTLAAKKWRNVNDGAEAFTLANDGRVMCLATRMWAETWTETHPANLQQGKVPDTTTKTVITKSASNEPGPLARFIAGSIVLIGLVSFIVFTVRLITRALRWKRLTLPTHTPPPLWMSQSVSGYLKSACTVAAPPPLPTAAGRFPASNSANPKTLEDLSWQEFELMVGELYRRQGYAVEIYSGDGSDGGVDLRLRKDGQTTLVQCKHWKVYKVGVSPVRELFGILVAEKADRAILVTTGRFTQDAQAFAKGKSLELIDGKTLTVTLGTSKYTDAGDLLDVASWSSTFAQAATITTPACPFCRSAMVLRRGKQSGNQFWGCSTYPGCRGKRNVRPELIRA